MEVSQPILEHSTNHTFALCAHGESEYLEECLNSLVNQTVPTNVILCTSTPNGLIKRLAEQYCVPLHINPNSNCGMQQSWNFAVEMSQTDYVTVCHQDDYYDADYFASIQTLLGQPDILMLHTGYLDVLDGNKISNMNCRLKRFLNFPLQFRPLQASKFVKTRAFSLGNSVSCPSCTYNKAMIASPFFTSKLEFSCDWDLYVTLAKTSGRIVYVPKPLTYKRVHVDSATSATTIQLRTEEDLYLFKKLWPKPVAKLISMLHRNLAY